MNQPDRPYRTIESVRSLISTKDTSPATNALRVSRIALGVAVVFLVFNAYFAIQAPVWPQLTLVGGSLILCVGSAAGAWLSRRGRVTAGMGLLIGATLLVNLVGPYLFTGLGLLCALTATLLTTAMAGLTLPRRYVVWTGVAGASVAILALLADWWAPVDRLEAFSPIVSWVLVGGLILIYGGFLAGQFVDFTMRTKVIVAFLGIILISLGAVTLLNSYNGRKALTQVANEKLTAGAKQTAASLDEFISYNRSNTEIMARMPFFIRFLSSPVAEQGTRENALHVTTALHALTNLAPVHIASFALLDQNGLNVADTDPYGVGRLETTQEYFRIPAETGESYVSPVQFSWAEDRAYLYFASPIRTDNGETIGVLRVRYNAAVLQELVQRNNELAGPQSFAILLDENYMFLADGLAPELMYKTVTPLSPEQLSQLRPAGRLPDWSLAELSLDLEEFEAGLQAAAETPVFPGEVHPEDIDMEFDPGEDQVAVWRMKNAPWLVAFVQPQPIFLKPVQTQTTLLLSVTAMIALVVAGASILLGQFLVGPIIRLTEVAQRVAGGELTAQARVEASDETGQLAAAFNTMTHRLHQLIGSLEEQVAARTAELSLSLEVGQRAAAIRDLAELLPTITEFIGSHFDLYSTQIYLVDDLGQNLILRAGAGPGGATLLARHYSLPLADNSPVSRAASRGQAVVIPDTAESENYLPNPLLPQTRSELAVPLIIEGRVIGVLDLQARQANTFTDDKLPVFEAMATQLVISINSAEQWALTQEAQQKAETALRQLSREGWATRLASRPEGLGFVYDLSAVTPYLANGHETPAEQGLSAPMVVQNEPIGRLSVVAPPSRPLSEGERALVMSVAQQLAQKAENLRLFEITQQRVAREQLARRIVDRLRASRDIESAMKTAAEELNKALGTARTTVDLQLTPAEPEPGDKNS